MKSIRDAAAKRHATFQANKKLKAAGGTSAQVARDNQMYGNTFPSGGLTISAAGKAQAEANRKEAAAKKAAEAAAAKKEATRKSTFDPTRIFSDKTFNQYMQSGGIRGINMSVLNNPNNYLNKGMNERIKNEQFARFGDPFSTFRKNPNPNTLFGDDALQVGKSDKNFAAGKRGNPFGRPDQAFNIFRSADKGGPGSGPTPLTRETIKRFGPAALRVGSSFLPGYSIGSKLFNEGRSDSALSKSLSNVDNVNVGGLSIGFNSPESTDIGARVGRFFTSLPGKVVNAFTGGDDTKVASAGGLNIGGGVDSGEAEGSGTGRTVVSTDRDKNISYDIGGIARDVGLGLADAATFNKFDFDNLGRPGDDKTFTQKFETFKKSPLQQAIISKQLGIDAKRLINDSESAAKSLFKNYVGDIDASSKKGVRNPIARFLRDVGSDDATAMAGRAIDAFGYDDPNFSNQPNKLTKFLSSVSPIPNLSEENVQDIRHTLNKTVTEPSDIQGKSMLKNVPYTQALGFANRIVSGKLSDATGEAMNQLGMGNVGGIDDAINLGMQINTNKGLEGTVANKRFGELDTLIKKYGPGKGQIPTLPSIIKGIGGAIGSKGGGTAPLQILGGGNMTATLPVNQQVAQEVLPLPTTATQTGTDSGNLASIMQNAYQNQMSLYGMNPNYFANIVQPRFNRPRKRFRQVFNRGYF